MNIVELLTKAKEKLKYPKYSYHADHGPRNFKLVFSLAGENAKQPGTVNITDGRPFGNNTFYGRVAKNGQVEFYERMHSIPQPIKDLINEIVKDPIEKGKLFGQQYGYCCFCGTEITSKSSLKVGYGPICATNWGLPWGESDKEDMIMENL